VARALRIADAGEHIAQGSDIDIALPLPAGLCHARDLPGRGQLAQRNAANSLNLR